MLGSAFPCFLRSTRIAWNFEKAKLGTAGACGVAKRIGLIPHAASDLITHLDLNFDGCKLCTAGAQVVAQIIERLGALRELSWNLSGVAPLGVLAVVRWLPSGLTSRRAHALAAPLRVYR